MQVVGKKCERCTEPVKSNLTARGCLTCRTVMHIACFNDEEDDELCLTCGVDFSQQKAQASEKATQALDAAVEKGGTRYRLALVMALAAIGVGAGACAYFGESDWYLHTFLFMFFGFRGRSNVRLATVLAAACGGLLSAVFAYSNFEGQPVLAGLQVLALVFYVGAAALMHLDRNVQTFVGAHRRED